MTKFYFNIDHWEDHPVIFWDVPFYLGETGIEHTRDEEEHFHHDFLIITIPNDASAVMFKLRFAEHLTDFDAWHAEKVEEFRLKEAEQKRWENEMAKARISYAEEELKTDLKNVLNDTIIVPQGVYSAMLNDFGSFLSSDRLTTEDTNWLNTEKQKYNIKDFQKRK